MWVFSTSISQRRGTNSCDLKYTCTDKSCFSIYYHISLQLVTYFSWLCYRIITAKVDSSFNDSLFHLYLFETTTIGLCFHKHFYVNVSGVGFGNEMFWHLFYRDQRWPSGATVSLACPCLSIYMYVCVYVCVNHELVRCNSWLIHARITKTRSI